MKLAVGIAALFLTVAVGIHSTVTLVGVTGGPYEYLIGLPGYVVTLLFLFGGSSTFKIPRTAERIFLAAIFVALASTLFVGKAMLIWAALAAVLYFLCQRANDEEVKSKPNSVTSKQ